MKNALLFLAAFCMTLAACKSSEKDANSKTSTTANEETEYIDNGMPERADALLSRKDSVALAKLYHDYEKAVNDFHEKARTMDITSEDVDRQLEKLKTDFEASLAGNPHFAPAVELRSLLANYKKEMTKDDERKYDVNLKLDKDMPEEFVMHEKEMFFQEKWDEKLIKLLQEHPGFMECPPYMFKETLDLGIDVVTSTDGRVRYYSYISGQWRNVASVTCIRQYRSDSGQIIVSKVENDDSWGAVEEVHSLHVDGKTVYLLKKARNEGYYFITYHAEEIEGDKIVHPTLFDTKDNKVPHVKYDLEGPEKDWVAKYDEKNKTIYMRVTSKDDGYRLNDTYVTYTFDGKFFRLSGQHKD